MVDFPVWINNPIWDYVAVAYFLALWLGYSIFAKRIGLFLNRAIVRSENTGTKSVNENSKELDGLQASLEKLVHHKEKSTVKGINLHAFIYFITINNLSDRKVTLLGRKWILANSDGTTTVVEGEKIVGETPTILSLIHI